MKRTRLLLIGALGLGVVFASCGNDGQVGKQQWYNNSSLVDSEGFTFFKTTYQKAAYEVDYAKHVLAQDAPAEARSLAEKVIATYESMLPGLEQLAAAKQVIVPDKGALVFSAEHLTSPADSLASFDAAGYIHHVQHVQAALLDQFKRASRNTDKDLKQFAADKTALVKELYASAGGHEDEGAHH